MESQVFTLGGRPRRGAPYTVQSAPGAACDPPRPVRALRVTEVRVDGLVRNVAAGCCVYALALASMASAMAQEGVDPAATQTDPAHAEEIDAARRLFETNLDAIRRKDRAAYLATYLNSTTLARTGANGVRLGFTEHEAQTAGDSWPDVFDARDVRLVRLRPGVVYGLYRYRVTYGFDEHAGISERVIVSTPQGWRIAVTSAFDAPPGTPPPPFALTGATLIDGTGSPPLQDAVVIVRGGRIECAGTRDACPPPADVESLDLSGKWIVPGIVDAHVHFSQTGWVDGRPDAIDVRDQHPYEHVQSRLQQEPEHFFRAYLGSGVTAVFDVGGYAWTWTLRDSTRTDAPHVAASGPLLSTREFWLNQPGEQQFIHIADAEAARSAVRYLAANRSDAVKVWFIPDSAVAFENLALAVLAAGEEARTYRLPLIVHATGLREAKVALQAGAHLLVHSVDDQLVDDEFVDLARGSEVVYCPTLTVVDGYARLYQSALARESPRVDDPHACVDSLTLAHVAETAELDVAEPERLESVIERLTQRREVMRTNLRRLQAAGVGIAMGTDAGNPLTLHGPSVYAEMEAMQAAGLSALDVLVAATRGGARAMRREQELGSIEAGKIADLLVVDADPSIDIRNMRQLSRVMRGGELRAVGEFRRR
ncbi:MAG: amidohydrolase family protein [Candidatus Latescibacterota bacterium]|nr:MAG: amidohydrolase family protein [Candidatus Latescibacterota bacterium]